MAWTNPAAALDAYARARLAGTTEKSASLAAIRDAVGVGLRTALPAPPDQPGLTTAFGHQPGAIGAPYPFALSLWETGFTPTLNYSATDDEEPEGYADLGGTEGELTGTLAILVAVAPLGPDTARLQATAEAWELPLSAWVKANPYFDNTVAGAAYAGFGLETWPWGDVTHYCAVARVRVTIIR